MNAREELARWLRQQQAAGRDRLYLEAVEAAPAPAPAAVPAPAGAPPDPAAAPADPAAALAALDQGQVVGCTKCTLCETRTQTVFGVGNPRANVVLVGEAPGAQEDAQGEPFVGPAGQLLDRILGAIGFAREDVYICNVLKCRPPQNRDPAPDEVLACEPYLRAQLDILQPRVVLALGRHAAHTLLKTDQSLSRLRGKVHDYHGIPLMVTYHPAALLRNEKWKRPTWEDVQALRKLHDELVGQG